jgi:hypothetical protein
VPSSSRINFGKERFGLKKELCAILGGPDKSRTILGRLVQVGGRRFPPPPRPLVHTFRHLVCRWLSHIFPPWFTVAGTLHLLPSSPCRSWSTAVSQGCCRSHRTPLPIVGATAHQSRTAAVTSFSVRSTLALPCIPFFCSDMILRWSWLCRSTPELPRPSH